MKRDHGRTSQRADLEVEVDLQSEHNFYTGLTRNISGGGLFVATHLLRRLGDRVSLTFTLPGNDRRLAVETEVRWIRDNSLLGRQEGHAGMGLRFINLTDEAAQAIRVFLDQRDSIYHDDE
jgi:uncharacterized protein (TIGR02266 family)